MSTAARRPTRPQNGGAIVVGALAAALDRMRDRLAAQDLTDAAELVADLADAAHDYVVRSRRDDEWLSS